MAKQWHQLERLDHKTLKKLQQERAKKAQDEESAADRKRKLVYVGAALFVIVVMIVFALIIRKRSAEQAYREARQKLYTNKVVEIKGTVKGRSLGDWERLDPNFAFESEYTIKAEKAGYAAIQLQLENVLKVSGESILKVAQNTLDPVENRVTAEFAELETGEVTVAIALDGRDLLEVEAGGVITKGASGLFKVLYDRDKQTGEVVVKNGLVEVYAKKQPSKKVKVSGFYKVTFKRGEISNPTQASVIQYDWR